MNIILTTLNAKFIHSSLALRNLAAYGKKYKKHLHLKEYTINHAVDTVVRELVLSHPDIIGFSCYIWNVEMTLEIIEIINMVLPETKIIVGGPECEGLIERTEAIDIAVMGEGEATFLELMAYWVDGIGSLAEIQGIAYRQGTQIYETPPRTQIPLDDIPFAYNEDFEALQHRIIYYETTRGCPFRCQYCMSSTIQGIRYLSMPRIQTELDFFLKERVRQVKFVDRTFNCLKDHTEGIWRYLIEHDNGVTNFHFEIAADLLTEHQLALLKEARVGLFQFEVGVQSTNENTLQAIERKTDLNRLFERVAQVKALQNIHQHLDLIAGLPLEDYPSFGVSFNAVYNSKPEQCQLGFLKVLKGTGMREKAESYGIGYRKRAPYEVLYTNDISFEALVKLKEIEDVLERFYNSNQFRSSVAFALQSSGKTPFAFYEALAHFWFSKQLHLISHTKVSLYQYFWTFCKEMALPDLDILKALLRYDLLCNDNIKSIPEVLIQESTEEEKRQISQFYRNPQNIQRFLPHFEGKDTKWIQKRCNIEKFDFRITSFIENETTPQRQTTFLLFDYHQGNDYKALGYGMAVVQEIVLGSEDAKGAREHR